MSTGSIPSSYLSTDRKLEINNLFVLLGMGIMVKIMFNSNQPTSATIWGYGIASMCLFLILMISLALGKNQFSQSFSNFLHLFWNNAIPVLCLLILLFWVITLNVMYSTKLNNNTVPQEYHLYSLISSILTILQAIILYLFISNKLKENTSSSTALENKIESIDHSTVIYVLTVLNGVIIGMMQIVLTFFTTDG